MLFLFIAVSVLVLAAVLGRAQKRLSPEQRARALAIGVAIVESVESDNGVPITMDEVAAAERSGAKEMIWLDVRSDELRKVSWIPGSRPAAGFAADTVKPDKQLVIVYDTIGSAAMQKASQLNLDRGFRAVVRSLRGGVIAWAQAGRPFMGPNGETKNLRLSSGLWNLAPDAYRTSW